MNLQDSLDSSFSKTVDQSSDLTVSGKNISFPLLGERSQLPKDLLAALANGIRPLALTVKHSTLGEDGRRLAQKQEIFLYASEKMRRVKEMIDQVANTDVTIFIQGESGVGKEVVARSIHMNSDRRDKPFVKVNCAALPHELLESELFGYEEGAFTGAYRQKHGKFELANKGTIFLDEIGDLSPGLQAKLLQVLQDRQFPRLGGQKDIKVDVRVLVATNINIKQAVLEGRLREDLFYRLNVVNISLPPLRERKEEIPVLAEFFLDKYIRKYEKAAKPIDDSLMRALLSHDWPGNVRELENMIQRYLLLGEEEVLRGLKVEIQEGEVLAPKKEDDLLMNGPSLGQTPCEVARRVETRVINKALERTHYNRKKAADLLNVSYRSLLYKIKKYGIGNSA